MTPRETDITSRREFNAELKTLLREANANGVDVKGGWECRNGDGHPDWDIVVTEIVKNNDSE